MMMKRKPGKKLKLPRLKSLLPPGSALNHALFAITATVETALLAVGFTPASFGILSVATTFLIKVSLLAHDQYSLAKLQQTMDAMTAIAPLARAKGTLVDMTEEENRLRLFRALDQLMEIQDRNKEELLRNVVLGCIARPGPEDFQERNFRYITRIIEIEDLAVLRGNLELSLDLGPLQPGEARFTQGVPGITIARLVSAGLLEEIVALQGRHYKPNQLAKEYLDYIKLPEV